jgi:hypothetical protein
VRPKAGKWSKFRGKKSQYANHSADWRNFQTEKPLIRSSLGILEYCQGEGYTDQSAVDAEKKSISMLPASSGAPDTSGLANAESTGKQGSFLLNGNKTPLTKMADGKNTTVKSLCAQMGTATKNAVASMGNMNNGMPAMPNGMQMPSMPNGMQMPSTPGAPASPSNSQ